MSVIHYPTYIEYNDDTAFITEFAEFSLELIIRP